MSSANAVELVEVQVWILVDEDGNYVAEAARETLKDRYEADVGDLDGMLATRTVCVTVMVPKPRPVELSATVGAEPDAGELTVA